MRNENEEGDLYSRRQVLVFGGFLAPAILSPLLAQAQEKSSGRRKSEAAGTIAGLRGSANALRRGRKLSLRLDGDVYVQDALSTQAASRLQVALGKTTRLFMGENTHVTIDDHILKRGGVINLSSGSLLFQRKPPDPKPAVSIRSPFAHLAVRGTTVFAGPSNGVFGVFVADGEVEVSAAGRSVILRPGQGTNIARPGDAPTAAVSWGKARIDAALASVR